MSLFELTKRNVQRNFRLYTIYLFSMIIGVMIHFTFSSLLNNKDILSALENKTTFQVGVTITSIVLSLFIIFFILYCNSFFMKQRKKEFGMYVLFGMSERQVAVMVFYEALIIGTISLVIGILLGGLLSKLFGTILMSLMQYNNIISLSFPIQAMGMTVLLFFFLIIIISIQSYFSIKRVQLIELFYANKKREKPFHSSSIIAILSILLLGVAVILITRGKDSNVWQDHSTISLIAVVAGIIVGTYLFFRQFTGWYLETLRKKKRYYKGNTVLWTSSLRFQVRGNALNLTFIALFSTVIMMLMAFVYINYKVQFEAVGKNVPNSIAFQSIDQKTDTKIDNTIKNSNHSILYHKRLETLVVNPNTDMNVAFENPGSYSKNILLVSETTFNKIVSLRNDSQKVNLDRNEAVSLSQGTDFPKHYEKNKQPNFSVETKEKTNFNLVEIKDYALLGWATDPVSAMLKKPAMLIISDKNYEELKGNNRPTQFFEIYHIKNAKEAESLSKQVYKIVNKTKNTYYSSFADVYSKQIEGSALALFAATFLAIIALCALASIIYFKQLREATEEQEQYNILRKIGIENKEIKNIIGKQLLFVFLPPLILGILHSWLVIKYYILASVQNYPGLTLATIGIFSIYIVIYMLFYVSSINVYYKIVQRKY